MNSGSSEVQGNFQDCGSSISLNLTCTGIYCDALTEITGVTCSSSSSNTFICSNANSCSSYNTASQFEAGINENGVGYVNTSLMLGQITYTQDTTIDNGVVDIIFNGSSGQSAPTSPPIHSAGVRFKAHGLKFFMTLAFVVSFFVASVDAQSQFNGQLTQVWEGVTDNQTLQGLFNPTVVRVCNQFSSNPGALATQAEVTFFCINTADSLLWNTPPFVLYSTVAEIFCARLGELVAKSGANVLCGTSPTTSASASTLSTTATSSRASSSTQASPSNSPGGPLPQNIVQNSCISCLVSNYIQGIIGLAQQCHVSSPKATAGDLSVFFCDPTIKPSFSQFCSTLCANPCTTYDIQTLINQLGSAYSSTPSQTLCSDQCPGFTGMGRCSSASSCNICGVGAGTCVPCG